MVRESYENKVDAWLWEREEKEELIKKNFIAGKVKSYHNDISEDKKRHEYIKNIGNNLNIFCPE